MGLVERAALRPLWPGFDPRAVPVAVFDGERTLLFRHPVPPEGFSPLPDASGVLAFPGRHPGVQANTSAKLGGVETATVLVDGSPSASALARLIVHEAFHVFQRARHPGWVANEAELFVYPVDDADLLRLRRLETEALRRALLVSVGDSAACWARLALELRSQRFSRLSAGAAAYERGTELNEGLASYVERLAFPDAVRDPIPADDFPAEAVRERSYATGSALARLLDRFAPAWKDAQENGGDDALDERLRSVLGSGPAAGCGFTESEGRLARERAERDVAAFRRAQVERREAFLAAAGWRIEVIAATEPLWPQGFDPLNVQRLGPGEVLHSRWLKLGNGAGAIEVLGRAALSEAAGEHPLFNGVRRLLVTGLDAAPAVRDSAGIVIVESEGLVARFAGSARAEGGTLTLRLGAR